MNYGIAIAIVVTAIILVGGAYISMGGGTSIPEVSETDHVKGSADAKLVLIEYSDFECPACAQYAEVLKRLTDEYSNDLAIVFRHYPLPQHTNAKLAARAAIAAGYQGKFWEMHDLIYENQESWSGFQKAGDTFLGYAEELELDIDKFQVDIESPEANAKVNSDLSDGRSARIMFTPTFYLNGSKIDSPRNYEEFKAVIEGELGG